MPSIGHARRLTVVTGLVVLVALSGCAGLSETGSQSPSTTAVSSPAPAKTTTPTASPSPTATPVEPPAVQFPPGLNTTGVHNATRLLRTHQTEAIQTPGVVTHATNSTFGNRSVVATVRVAAEQNLTRVRYVSEAQRPTDNGTETVASAITANETSVRQYTAVGGNVTLDNNRNRTDLFERALRGLSTATSPLRGALQRGNFSITEASDRPDTEAIPLRADRYAGGQLFGAENVVAYNATVVVTTEGLVRAATERITAQQNGETSQYTFTYSFEPQSVTLPSTPQVPADVRVEPAPEPNG